MFKISDVFLKENILYTSTKSTFIFTAYKDLLWFGILTEKQSYYKWLWYGTPYCLYMLNFKDTFMFPDI
jgi:hypothetical protein